MLNDPKLTPKQNNFVEYYLMFYNATKAYQLAYPHVKASTARRNGSRLLTNADIQRQITHERKLQSTSLHCDRLDILKQLVAMFFTDVGDYVDFGNHFVTSKHNQRYRRSYLYFKNSKNIDTRYIQSITKGRNGSRIELPNKVQLGELLMQYLPSPRNTNIHKDTLVIAFENGLRNQQRAKNKHGSHKGK